MIELFFVVSLSTSSMNIDATKPRYSLEESCERAKQSPDLRVWYVAYGGDKGESRSIKCKHVEATKAHWEEDKEVTGTVFISTSVFLIAPDPYMNIAPFQYRQTTDTAIHINDGVFRP